MLEISITDSYIVTLPYEDAGAVVRDDQKRHSWWILLVDIAGSISDYRNVNVATKDRSLAEQLVELACVHAHALKSGDLHGPCEGVQNLKGCMSKASCRGKCQAHVVCLRMSACFRPLSCVGVVEKA